MMNSGLDASLVISGTSIEDLGIKEKPDPQWEYVDMGSAGKWMKCNLGSTTAEGYGDYYAWGELEPYYQNWTDRTTNPTSWKSGKTSGYTSSSYTLGENIYDSTTLVLKNEYDVLYQKSSGKFRMPTSNECTALCNLSNTWTTLNGVYGRQFTATNGNTLFIPASGYFFDKSNDSYSESCWGWTSSRNSQDGYANLFYFKEGELPSVARNIPYRGYIIRGIKIE